MKSVSSPQPFRIAFSVFGASLIVVFVGLAFVRSASFSLDPMLFFLDGPIYAWVNAVEWLRLGLFDIMVGVRWPVLVVVVGFFVWRGREAPRDHGLLLASLLVGLIAQSFVADGLTGLGVILYGMAVLPILFRWEPPPRALTEPNSRLEFVLVLFLLALFSLFCLYRVDVYPPVYFDEVAYLKAAYMQSGELPQGYILPAPLHAMYSFERFQSQLIPFYAQAFALSAFDAGLFSLRVASWLSNLMALSLAYLFFRKRLGVQTALWMLALACCSTLLVAYSRTGFYLSFCILGGVVAFWSLHRLQEKWNTSSAFLVGLIAGLSVYFYQLSWFIPPALALCLLMQPSLLRRSGAFRLGAVTLATLALVVAPLLLVFAKGLEDVSRQTFDKKQPVWELPETLLAAFILPADLMDRIDPDLILAKVADGDAVYALVLGSKDDVMQVVEELDTPEVIQLSGFTHRNPIVSALDIFFSKTFIESGWESNGRINERPILNPLLAPLVVLGFAVAWRRRSNAVLWTLLIWVAFVSFFPSLIAGMVPRRLLLGIPFVQVMMGLVLAEISGSLATRTRLGRWIVMGSLIVFWLAAFSESARFYANGWSQPGTYVADWIARESVAPAAEGNSPERLKTGAGRSFISQRFEKEAAASRGKTALPADSTLAMNKMTYSLPAGLPIVLDDLWLAGSRQEGMLGNFDRDFVQFEAGSESVYSVLDFACAQPLPFIWITGHNPERVLSVIMLAQYFEHIVEYHSGLRVMTILARKSDDCEKAGFPDPG